jgi:hypothetical protein
MSLIFPSNPTLNQTYQTGSSATYRWNGTYWVVSTPPISGLTVATASYAERVVWMQPTPPPTGTGSLWYDQDTGNMYVKYDAAWVPAQSTIGNAVSSSFAATARSASFATTASTTTLAYANVYLGGTWPTTNNTDITIRDVSGSGVTAAANVITIQNAGVYTLSANCSIPSNFAEYFWTDTSNVQVLGTNVGISASPTGSFTHDSVTAAGIITAAAGTQIKLRTSIVSSVVPAAAPYYYNVQIIQIR